MGSNAASWTNNNGNCVINTNVQADQNLQKKHLCSGCASEADALAFSVAVSTYFQEGPTVIEKTFIVSTHFQRNQHCLTHGCARSGTNTVFQIGTSPFEVVRYGIKSQ